MNYVRTTKPAHIDLNPVEFDYYIFMIRLDKCNRSCNIMMIYLQKYVFQVQQKT